MKPMVYLADDDRDLRLSLIMDLRDAGYDVLAAGTGQEMLAMLTAASRDELPAPDLIVMDVRMPRCGGIDVLQALRLAEWKQPVIIITGFGDPELHARAVESGASVVLDKPFDSTDLVDMAGLLLGLEDRPPPITQRSPRA